MSVKRPGAFKDIEIPSLDGLFDTRSPSGLVGFGNYRVVLNMDATQGKSRCRLGGWTKFQGDSPHGFKNQDFHDQMLDCLTYREPFEGSVFVPAGISSYAYPYWNPGYDTAQQVVDDTPLGPFYGYSPGIFAGYPQASPSTAANTWFLCDVVVGAPYTPEATDDVYWNADNNIPTDLIIPNGSSLAPESERWFTYAVTSETKLTAGNSTAVLKTFGASTDNPETGISPALLAQWKSDSYNALVQSRVNQPIPKYVTSVRFFWEYLPDVSSGWAVDDYYDTGFFTSRTTSGWTLSVMWAESESADSGGGGSGEVGLSSYNLCRFQIQPSVHVDSYGYGTQQALYSGPYGYNYTNCGTYTYNRAACREVVTLLREVSSVSGRRKFLVGTKSKIAVLNERGGNWRILADGLGGPYSDTRNCGCPAARPKVSQLGNIVIFTNDIDPVLFWTMDSGPDGCDDWSLDYVQDLVALNITRAKVTVSWRGFVFIANVEQEGRRYSNRIFWCDYNDPLTWFPGGDTLAFTQDLADGDRIVAMETIGQQLRIYTRRGANQTAIYDVMLVGGDATFNFQEVYRGPDGVQYENSMVNLGDTHYWVSESGIMQIGAYDRTPNRIEWVHRASGALYIGIPGEWLGPLKPFAMELVGSDWSMTTGFHAVNQAACDMVNGFFDSKNKALWFSWPTGDALCPTMSLRLNFQYNSASLVDHGFTAGCMMRPDYSISMRDFLAEFAGCNPAGLLMPKEGMPYEFPTPIATPAYIRNATEDPDLPVDPNSVCAQLGDMTIDDLCAGCDADSLLVMADAQDRTLKQFTQEITYRERYVGGEASYDCPYTSPGIYVLDGYFSLVQADAWDYGQKVEKTVRGGVVDYVAEDQIDPNQLHFEVGYGPQPRCLTWDQSAAPQDLACLTEQSAAEHAANSTRPELIASYHFFRRGVYIAWRAYTSGTGGASCWDKATLSMRLAQGEWPT